MAMDVGGGGRGKVKADINVTPLVDVMLVLLIIMMLVAPMLQQGVAVKLPVASNTDEKPDTQEQTVLAVTADKRFFVNGIQVREDDMRQRVTEMLEDKKEKIVFIRGDEDAPYGSIMAAMDKLREVGIETVGLITERELRRGQAGGQ
ncbi:MAG: biopolymer transporter ExbD [Acidobacteria bacterium]|nr:biopolymer transporter ExbD [Acidobacteriota bacterium]MBI3264649.1 biopolymer transporter ExbD [Acidobacteriota bacterium]